MKSYQVYTFKATEAQQEILLGLFSTLDFDSFQETEESLLGYVAKESDTPDFQSEVQQICQKFDVTYQVEAMPEQNWNALWESNFQPIQVGSFCGIRADFHPPFEAVRFDLVINPKMAFGTGHHATTYMMIKLMEALPFQGASVFDYGTGTGILAVLASHLGASRIIANDIEEEAYLNTLENTKNNGVDNVEVLHGDISLIPEEEYDVILANINRNVILESLPALYLRLQTEGHILFSGILQEDEHLVKTEAEKAGFIFKSREQKQDWIALQMTK